MFPLSPTYGNSAPVSAGTWRGDSVSTGGVSVGLTSPEGAQPVPPPTLGCLREPGKTAERGNSSAAPVWGDLCLPGCGQLQNRRPSPIPNIHGKWHKLQCLSGVLKFCIKNQ